jgi:hypothetical protein
MIKDMGSRMLDSDYQQTIRFHDAARNLLVTVELTYCEAHGAWEVEVDGELWRIGAVRQEPALLGNE